ncbi:MAG: ABC transporter ATP-binding protein [Bacteroidales bacterium]|nr:ABC transporter ATP-binding protein [Bacteroidales bacterium]
MDLKPVIQIQGLSKFYGKITGVQNISFDVHQGEVFGFLGPNGAGKTTTIRLILDLLRPSAGTIEIFGINLAQNSFEIRRRCGYLPGSFSAYGNLNGMEFLHLCADLRNIPRKVDPKLLDRFGLSGKNLEQKIKYLSHGTLQKLGIIQAFFHHPELLILDEPTTGLDPLMQEAFYDLLKEQMNKGCTIFFSSHNLAEVERICHRLAIIRKGEIERVDSIESLRKMLKKRLRFTLSQPAGDFMLPGAEFCSRQDLTYEYLIHGDIRMILKKLAELPPFLPNCRKRCGSFSRRAFSAP